MLLMQKSYNIWEKTKKHYAIHVIPHKPIFYCTLITKFNTSTFHQPFNSLLPDILIKCWVKFMAPHINCIRRSFSRKFDWQAMIKQLQAIKAITFLSLCIATKHCANTPTINRPEQVYTYVHMHTHATYVCTHTHL